MGQNDCISCRPLQTVTMLSMKQITLFVAVLACSLVAASAETRKLMQGAYPPLFPILDPTAFGGLQNSLEGLVGNVANPFPDSPGSDLPFVGPVLDTAWSGLFGAGANQLVGQVAPVFSFLG